MGESRGVGESRRVGELRRVRVGAANGESALNVWSRGAQPAAGRTGAKPRYICVRGSGLKRLLREGVEGEGLFGVRGVLLKGCDRGQDWLFRVSGVEDGRSPAVIS